jgi:uncharacterized protein YecA (UPF0149 family)
MKPYELSIICDSLHLRHKDSWEQARLIAYVTAQANSTKKLKPSDIIKFGWEQTEDKQDSTQSNSITLEEFERIKAMALQREQKLKDKGII